LRFRLDAERSCILGSVNSICEFSDSFFCGEVLKVPFPAVHGNFKALNELMDNFGFKAVLDGLLQV
jgi:hypothetical protein